MQGEEVPCHRSVLLARCPTLAHGVTATMKEGAEGRWQVRGIEGKEVDVAVLKELLTFIYTGDHPEHKARTGELLEVAHMYQLAGLVRACRDTLLRGIRPWNAVNTLVMLDRFGDGEDEAKDQAVEYIKRNAKAVVKTEDWKVFVSNYGELVTDIVKALAN